MKEWQVLIIIMPVPFLIWKYGVTMKNTHTQKKNPAKMVDRISEKTYRLSAYVTNDKDWN